MSLFLSTDDGQVLLVQLDQRRAYRMADFGVTFTDLALTGAGDLLAASDRLVWRLDIPFAQRTTIAAVPGGGIVGLDVDGSDRAVIGTAAGQVWRQEADGRLSDIGRFADGIEGGIARIGGYAWAATGAGRLAVMSLRTGDVEEVIDHRLGQVSAISAAGRILHLTVVPPSGQPQVWQFDTVTGALVFEGSLLGFYDQITGATEGVLDTVVYSGGQGDEEFIGTALDDLLTGGAGDDRAYARDGNDTLTGGAGDDLLMGEAGSDLLEGGAGDDLLNGGGGRDWALFPGAAATVDLGIRGPQQTGHGIDRLAAVENLRGSDFGDRFEGDGRANLLEGMGGSDTLLGDDGNDRLDGGDGDDVLVGGAGDDLLLGGAGFDIARYDGEAAVTIRLGLTARQDTGGQGQDILRDIEAVIGSSGDDLILGNLGDNRLAGGDGADTLRGGNGNDTLLGDAGDDDLLGGDGADRIWGGAGNDRIDGGRGAGADMVTGDAGADVFVFAVRDAGGQIDARLTITDFDAAEGDRISLVGAGPADFGTWTLTDLSGGAGCLIAFPGGGELLLEGVAAADVAGGWFL